MKLYYLFLIPVVIFILKVIRDCILDFLHMVEQAKNGSEYWCNRYNDWKSEFANIIWFIIISGGIFLFFYYLCIKNI